DRDQRSKATEESATAAARSRSSWSSICTLLAGTAAQHVQARRTPEPRGDPMRAFAVEEFGAEGSVRELPDPTPADGQVRVRVEAASVNPADLAVLRGPTRTSPSTTSRWSPASTWPAL